MGERGAFFYAMEMGHRGEVICFGAEKAQIHLVNSLKSDLHTDYLPPFVIAFSAHDSFFLLAKLLLLKYIYSDYIFLVFYKKTNYIVCFKTLKIISIVRSIRDYD